MNTNFENKLPGITESGRLEVLSPWDFTPVGSVPCINANAAERVLETASAVFKDKNRWLSAEMREKVLQKTAEIMQREFDQLAMLAASEGGKPLLDSKVEVARAIDGVKNAIELLRNDAGREIPMNRNAASANKIAMTRKEPIGVVMSVSAFNHPLNLIVHQVIPAIAAGCPVIIKPAEDTPLSCFRLVEILYEAGLAPEYCMAVMSDNLDVATQLVTDSRIAFFSFIGSAKVGWMLRSKLAAGTRCALEHGGAAPVIVAQDADLDEMLPRLAKGGFYHAGQVCVSVQRVYVHRSIAQTVANRLGEIGRNLKIGDPLLEDTEVGPLIRPSEVSRVAQWVDEAIAQGAQLIEGGQRLSESSYACTVLLNPAEQSQVTTQEIFGPVICVYPYDSIDQAISAANNVPFAFQAAVATQNIDTAMYCYQQLNASAIMVNDHTAFRVDWMPFAGLKLSGLGVGGIPATFDDMQIEKMLVIHSKKL